MDSDERRLRSLIEAVIEVGEGLDLPVVLQRIVTTACDLTRARYGALGVQDDAGRIVEFYGHGVDDEVRDRLGGHPHGLGIPGTLLAAGAQPLRLDRIEDHAGFTGFPPGHPPMTAFLGVPIRVHDQVFGNLYVSDPTPSETFTEQDEDVLRALATAAGVAVGNARLYEAVQRRQVWWEAATKAVQAIVDPNAGETAQVLTEVAGVAAAAARADRAAVYLASQDAYRLTAVWPPSARDGGDVPATLTSEDVHRSGGTSAGPAAGCAPDATPDGGTPQGPAEVVLPLTVGREDVGVLVLRCVGGRPADEAESDLMQTFADRVALALEAARAASDRSALALLQDRDRIARDLHDLVIQRIFAVGLSLQAAANLARVPEVAARLARAVDDLDDTIKDVRRTIFQLHGTGVRSPLRDDLEALVATARDDLGIAVRLVLEGPVVAVPDSVAPDVLAVVREGLSNVAKHAQASRVTVLLRVGRHVELEVGDDGVGLSGDARRSGLANLEERALAHGGSCRVTSQDGGGTTLVWTAPRR